jgi:hypothetical protein
MLDCTLKENTIDKQHITKTKLMRNISADCSFLRNSDSYASATCDNSKDTNSATSVSQLGPS